MAATKKSAVIAEKKRALVAQIEELFLAGHRNLNRVPDFVNCGSYPVAVAWKQLVEKYFAQPGFTIPERTSLTEVELLLAAWRKRLDQLTGKASLVEQNPQEDI